MLSSEIDNIDEQNSAIELEIQRNEKMAELTAKDKEIVRQGLKQEIEERST
jgi:hypothetical protein